MVLRNMKALAARVGGFRSRKLFRDFHSTRSITRNGR